MADEATALGVWTAEVRLSRQPGVRRLWDERALPDRLEGDRRDAILVVPPSCLTVMQGLYPIAATQVSALNVTFASTAAAASGVRAALRARKNDHTRVVAWAGDGGTADIGIQALSGALERGEDFLYICYDNEAYMNTGVQRSGTTPLGAVTTNTTCGKRQRGKDVPAIVAAHSPAYVATCSASYPLDFHDKVEKALGITGLKYIHIQTPCPPGWGIERLTIAMGRLAVETACTCSTRSRTAR
jgi:pyruvate ferredoxin oxidoreductase beta subunit